MASSKQSAAARRNLKKAATAAKADHSSPAEIDAHGTWKRRR